jgi:hypothetical protein
MRYHFIDEIVSLALDGKATPIASATLMFVCVEPTAVGLARGPGA